MGSPLLLYPCRQYALQAVIVQCSVPIDWMSIHSSDCSVIAIRSQAVSRKEWRHSYVTSRAGLHETARATSSPSTVVSDVDRNRKYRPTYGPCDRGHPSLSGSASLRRHCCTSYTDATGVVCHLHLLPCACPLGCWQVCRHPLSRLRSQRNGSSRELSSWPATVDECDTIFYCHDRESEHAESKHSSKSCNVQRGRDIDDCLFPPGGRVCLAQRDTWGVHPVRRRSLLGYRIHHCDLHRSTWRLCQGDTGVARGFASVRVPSITTRLYQRSPCSWARSRLRWEQ